jgi:CHAT domain-containing protein/tetratricopeptide (TPR) repeat protein
VNREQNHLTIEQIECLIGIRPVEGAAPESARLREQAQAHLDECEPCRKLLSMEIEADRNLRDLQRGIPIERHELCPPSNTLYELAGGVLKEQDSETLMKHITECDHCGPAFGQVVSDLGSEGTSEEASIIASLATSRPQWQEEFARRLASTATKEDVEVTPVARSSPRERLFFSKIRWAYAVAAVLIIVVTVIEGGRAWHSRPSYTQQLLADAYTERRTLEVRIPGARYAPLRVNRGEQSSNIDRPASLLEAEALIRRGLTRQPGSTAWLQQKVRADLLDGNFDAAIHAAEPLLEQEPDSASVLGDLGSAYFLRAERDRTAIDYGRAYECLSKSLAKKPDDPVTLFNRAIVSERAQLYAQAQEDWKHYLNLDTDREWRAEARARLQEVEHKLQEQKERSQQSSDSSEQVAVALGSGLEDRISEIDSVADSYQTIALEEWIPELASGRTLDSGRHDSLETALGLLAGDLRVRHQDSWLTDFLSERATYSSSEAVRLLVRAIQESAAGNQESAIRLATAAEAGFRKERNEPGRMRASFEMIYANRLAAHGERCHESAEGLLNEVKGRNYAWIEIQSQLEAAACANEISRIEESIVRSQKALELAKAAKYGNLELRATMFVADSLTDPNMRFNLLRAGLVAYWSGHYESMRGYSLYAAMDYTSGDDLHLWFLDKAVIKEGLRLIESDPDLALRGLERYRLARAQLATDETDEAKRTVIEATALLSQSASPALNTGASIDLADAFVIKGRYEDALELLATVEPHLPSFTHDIVLGKFYGTKATALLGERQNAAAERALLTVLRLARKALRSISSERDRLSWVETLEPAYRSLAYLQLQKDVESSFRWWESFKGGSLAKTLDFAEESESIADWEPSLPRFDSWPGEGTLLLSYATFPEGTEVWAYDGKQVHGLWLPGSSDRILQIVRRFREDCSDPASDPNAVLIEGRELYDFLVEPAAEWIKGRSRLIVETDSSLESIPFEALVDKRGGYLADSYEIDYSAGLFYMTGMTRSERISRESRTLIVGQSLADTEDGLPSLPGVLDEARDVAARFDKSVLLMDDNADLAAIKRRLPGMEVFHFAGHAIASRNLNGLVLAVSPNDDSRILDAGNFNSQLLGKNRLIVLSACATANGTGPGPNDRESLARSALAAGVPNVVASRWVVDSFATREWMKSFYTGAVSGESISAAAKEARSTLRSKPGWRHPYYWASFSVFV